MGPALAQPFHVVFIIATTGDGLSRILTSSDPLPHFFNINIWRFPEIGVPLNHLGYLHLWKPPYPICSMVLEYLPTFAPRNTQM